MLNNSEELFIIDRIENEIIALEKENREIIFISKEDMINNIYNEGDVVKKDKGKYYVCKEETEKRKNEINNLTKGIWAE